MDKQGDIAARLAQCKAAADRSAPLTPAELTEYNSQRAREMAKADARRQPLPQLDLDKAA